MRNPPLRPRPASETDVRAAVEEFNGCFAERERAMLWRLAILLIAQGAAIVTIPKVLL